jgi:hypothetical protein
MNLTAASLAAREAAARIDARNRTKLLKRFRKQGIADEGEANALVDGGSMRRSTRNACTSGTVSTKGVDRSMEGEGLGHQHDGGAPMRRSGRRWLSWPASPMSQSPAPMYFHEFCCGGFCHHHAVHCWHRFMWAMFDAVFPV